MVIRRYLQLQEFPAAPTLLLYHRQYREASLWALIRGNGGNCNGGNFVVVAMEAPSSVASGASEAAAVCFVFVVVLVRWVLVLLRYCYHLLY
jgi:hypothetical protein